MRLKLTLSCKKNAILPLNNRYELSSAIYKIISKSNPEFSDWLHHKGYGTDGRSFKLFTFGWLNTYPFDRVGDGIITRSGIVTWEISFCIDELIENFVAGLFHNQQFGLGAQGYAPVDFSVQNVEILPSPTFTETMRYQALTPILISENVADSRHKQFRSPLDEGYEALFLHNLAGKVAAGGNKDNNSKIQENNTNSKIKNSKIQKNGNNSIIQNSKIQIASTYSPPLEGSGEVLFRLTSNIKSKPVWLNKTSLERPIMLRPYLFDFELIAPVAWHKVGYFAGFGAESSMGLGMCAFY